MVPVAGGGQVAGQHRRRACEWTTLHAPRRRCARQKMELHSLRRRSSRSGVRTTRPSVGSTVKNSSVRTLLMDAAWREEEAAVAGRADPAAVRTTATPMEVLKDSTRAHGWPARRRAGRGATSSECMSARPSRIGRRMISASASGAAVHGRRHRRRERIGQVVIVPVAQDRSDVTGQQRVGWQSRSARSVARTQPYDASTLTSADQEPADSAAERVREHGCVKPECAPRQFGTSVDKAGVAEDRDTPYLPDEPIDRPSIAGLPSRSPRRRVADDRSVAPPQQGRG